MSDRPPLRALVRIAALGLGRARAHRQDVWPHLRIERETAEVRWRGRHLTWLQPFTGVVPRGASLLAIIGSGPSVAGQRVERLPSGCAILLNGAASLAGRVNPLAVAVEDERFVFRHHPMLAAVHREVPLFLSAAAMRAIAERDPSLLTGRPICLIDNVAKPVGRPRRGLDDPALAATLRRDGDAALSLEPDAGLVITGTVAFSAVQIALEAAPRQILLVGIDLGNADQARFYENDDRAPSGLAKGLPRILAGFALAQKHAATCGIALSCASPVSSLLAIGYPRSDVLDSSVTADE